MELGACVPRAVLRTSNTSVRVSTRLASCGRRLPARELSLCSLLLPGAAFPGSSSWHAWCRRSSQLAECLPLAWDFPRSPGQSTLWLLSLATPCHPARPVPFPSAFQGFQLCSTAVAGGNVGNEAPLNVSTSGVGSCEVLSVRYK